MVQNRDAGLQIKNIDDFFKFIVNDWMVYDISVCERKDNHANIATVVLLCCYTEFLGSLITGKGRGNERNNLYAFCESYLGRINPKYDNFKCKLYEDFRCGLVHQYFPKKGTGIVKDDDSRHFVLDQDILYVNITKYYEDFKKAILTLREDVIKKQAMKRICLKRLKDEGIEIDR